MELKLSGVEMSETVALNSRAQALIREGKDIIALVAGEPDLPTPENIRGAGKAAIDAGKTRYAPPAGIPELRDAICRKLRTQNDLHYGPEQVVVGCGAKQPIFSALRATVGEGDEVVIPAPYWVSYVDITRLVGGTPVIVQGRGPGRRLTARDLEAAITPASKWLMLCSPSNPSGIVYSAQELAEICGVLERHPHVNVLIDHIYEHLVYDGVVALTPNAVSPSLHDRTLIVNGLSKSYCMTGWRVGYAAGPKPLIDAMTALQSQITTSTSTISQWAAVEALVGDQQFLSDHRAVFVERRNLVVDALNAVPGLRCYLPEGAFYAFPECGDVLGSRAPDGRIVDSDAAFANYLLDQGVAVAPGVAFGTPGHFRLSYAASTEDLTEAMKRIRKAVEQLELAR